MFGKSKLTKSFSSQRDRGMAVQFVASGIQSKRRRSAGLVVTTIFMAGWSAAAFAGPPAGVGAGPPPWSNAASIRVPNVVPNVPVVSAANGVGNSNGVGNAFGSANGSNNGSGNAANNGGPTVAVTATSVSLGNSPAIPLARPRSSRFRPPQHLCLWSTAAHSIFRSRRSP